MPSLPSSRLSQSAFRPQRPKATLFPLKNWPADPKIANKLNQHLSILKTTVMKKLIFPAVAALALGLASCSSDEVNPGNGGGQPSFAQGGYAKVAINLPSQSGSSRAVSDGDQGKFDDGLASEYKVNKATLVLFQGGTEAGAKFHSAYNLPVSMEDYTPDDGSKNQITTTTRIVKRVNDGDLPGNQLYAMVILNGGDNVKVGSDNVNDVYIYGLKMTSSTTLSDFEKLKVWDVSSFTNNGILMSNAPLATKVSGSAGNEIKTLVNFTKAVYKTEAEAQASPATDIYVERAVGKVTVKSKSGKLSKPAPAGSTTPDPTEVHFKGSTDLIDYQLVGWDLDLANQVSFFSRNVDKAWNDFKSNATGANYRFIGTNPVKTGAELYRTYFAKDPNYDWTAVDATNFTHLAKTHTFNTGFDDDAPQYCLENTFTVVNQNQNQTTRAILKVKIGDGSTFYTFNGDNSTLYKQTEAETRIKQIILHVLEGKDGFSSLTEAGIRDVTLSGYDATKGTVSVTKFVAEKKVAVTTGGTTTTTIQPTTFEGAATELSEVNTALNTITMYKDGIAYYPVRIKHFGDDLTPWSKTEAPAPTPGTIYPTDNANGNYLGRYGVVRNNWYEIAVNSIKGIGSSIIPDPTDEPDDELYNYIAVRINVLSWAKRTQNEDL